MHSPLRSLPSRTRFSMMRAAALCAVLAVGAAACGGSAEVDVANDSSADTTATSNESAPATDVSADTETAEDAPVESTEPDEPAEAAEPEESDDARIVSGAFELVLADGTAFAAPIQCVLEPQIAAGSEILFTAGGTHEGQFYDVTQWGETLFGGTQDVEITDMSSFDTLWRATGSTGLVLELNGNVISGSGDFYQGENLNGPYTSGELTVTC